MSNTSTDPAGFDSEATGAFRVATLAERLEREAEESVPLPLPAQPLATAPAGPSLVYVHSLSSAQTMIDRHAPGTTIENNDDRLRELSVARALLVHALRLVDRELNR